MKKRKLEKTLSNSSNIGSFSSNVNSNSMMISNVNNSSGYNEDSLSYATPSSPIISQLQMNSPSPSTPNSLLRNSSSLRRSSGRLRNLSKKYKVSSEIRQETMNLRNNVRLESLVTKIYFPLDSFRFTLIIRKKTILKKLEKMKTLILKKMN